MTTERILNSADANKVFVDLLNLPKDTYKAVLTLEAGYPPRLVITARRTFPQLCDQAISEYVVKLVKRP